MTGARLLKLFLALFMFFGNLGIHPIVAEEPSSESTDEPVVLEEAAEIDDDENSSEMDLTDDTEVDDTGPISLEEEIVEVDDNTDETGEVIVEDVVEENTEENLVEELEEDPVELETTPPENVITYLKIRTTEPIVVNSFVDDPLFIGWSSEENGSVLYPAYQLFTITEDIDLYPIFAEEEINGKLDINARVNGTYRGNTNDIATFDVYIGDTLVKETATDFYKQYPAGTEFTIRNIQVMDGYTFTGLSSAKSYGGCVKTSQLDENGEIHGRISSEGISDVALSFISADYTGTVGNLAKISNQITSSVQKGQQIVYEVSGRENSNQAIIDWESSETDTGIIYYPIWVSTEYLDLNASINRKFKGNSSGYAKFDIFINGELSAHNVTDYYKRWPVGTDYRVVETEVTDGYLIAGAADHASNPVNYAYGGGMIGTVQDSRTEVLMLINSESVTVTRDLNDGSGEQYTDELAKGSDYRLPTFKGTRTGYVFTGWSYTPDGEVDVEDKSTINVTENTTLYAVWKLANYVDINARVNDKYKGSLNGYATFDVYANGVQVADDIVDFYKKYPVGTEIEVTDIKTFSGYVFEGTSERKSYTGVYHQNSLVFEVGGESVNDLVLVINTAPTGWYTKDDLTYYYREDGTKALGWTTIDEKVYYFDEEDGHLHTNERIDGKYVNEQGIYDETLVADFKVVDGVVRDVVSGKDITTATINEDGVHFTGDGTTSISLGKAHYNLTIEAIVDFDENNMTQSKTVYSTYDGTNGKIGSLTLVKNNNSSFGIKANRLAVEPYQSNLITVNSNFVNPVTGTNEYENLTTGDTFVALSGDVSNKVTIGQVNGAQSTNILKDVTWYYRTAYGTIYLNDTHQIRELKFYNIPKTAEQLMEDYRATGLASTVVSTITGSDGLVGLGSPTAWHFDENNQIVWDDAAGTPGVYTGTTTDGTEKNFAISEFNAEPNTTVDNSIYESIHITNKLSEIYLGKQYSLTAYPYPYNSNFDIIWSSSDNQVIQVVDGLIVANNIGSATITATLRGTDISDSFTMTVIPAPQVETVTYTVPENYTSAKGHTLNSENRQESMWAVYDAIDEAHEAGYTHIIFPNPVYVSAIERDLPVWYVPSNMTMEFTELHMVYQDYMKQNHQLHTFEFGVPSTDYTNRCKNSHLIVRQYYGERYEESLTGSVTEGNYIEELRFAQFGRKAFNCSVEINNAQYPAGYFITVDGTGQVNKNQGVITYSDLVSGRLDDNGNVITDSNWISTANYISVPTAVKTDGYFISNNGQSSYAAKYQRGCSARLMDVQWYDTNYNLISTDRFLATVEYYRAPENAEYFKLSLQQSDLPTPGTNQTSESPWLAMHDDGSAKFCEIKNTNVYNSATGMFSVVGETDGLWIHDNYVPQNGTKPGDERTGDLENGWMMMRHTVISKNVMDSSSFTAFASGGVGTVLHTNYFGNEIYTRPDDEQTKIFNNRGTSWILAVKDTMDFYHNTNYSFYFNSTKSSLKGWKCAGALHYNYNPGGWLNRN